jgi:NTE family protein
VKGLALSGGGFRATLFHVGSLLRINEAGLLKDLDEVTSVSGGSIIAAHLGLKWSELDFDDAGVASNFDEKIVSPIRLFCSNTIDIGTILGGIISPFKHPSEKLIKKYNELLYKGAALQDLPASGAGPRFTIYSTSLQTGASVRFSRQYIGEYHLGTIPDPDLEIAFAVASSSAFPPPLCPVKLELDPGLWKPSKISDLHQDEHLKSTMLLADGGVYDNLGLERLAKTCDCILVSDAGAPFGVNRKLKAARFSQLARTKRALDIMSNQVRALRARGLVTKFIDGEKKGAYWGIGTTISEFPLSDMGLNPALLEDSKRTADISAIRTRLNKFKANEQMSLINWGYALADAALRSRLDNDIAVSGSLPYASHVT